MPSPPPLFEVTRVRDGEGARLALRGELDMYSVPLLERELQRVVRAKPARIVLDLEGLVFTDVAGLRSILDAARRARGYGGSIVIANPVPHIIRLLELTALDQTLEVQGRPLSPVR